MRVLAQVDLRLGHGPESLAHQSGMREGREAFPALVRKNNLGVLELS